MAYTSTYVDGSFVLYDLSYPFKSHWLDGRTPALRNDGHFSYREYVKYDQSAKRILARKGRSYNSAISGVRFGFVPLIAKGPIFTAESTEIEDGAFVTRNRVGLNVRYYNTLTQTEEGEIFTFLAPTADFMGSLIKLSDKVALSKSLNLHSIYERVYNDTGGTLTAGTIVRYDGITNDGVVEIEPPDGNDGDNNVVGIIQEDILSGESGACASIKGPGAWIPNNILATPNDGGKVYISSDTGAISHTPDAGNQAIGSLLHEGTGGGAHYILFHQDY